MNTSSKYYSDPDEMPLINWEKCLNGKFSYMRLTPSNKYNAKDIAAFYKFYNEYIDRYKLPDQQMRYFEALMVLIDLRADYIDTGDNSILTRILIEKIIVEELKPSNEGGMTIGQMIVVLGKWFGSWINKKEITVGGYKDLIQEYERANKEK